MFRLIKGLLHEHRQAKELIERLEEQQQRELDAAVVELFQVQREWLNARKAEQAARSQHGIIAEPARRARSTGKLRHE